MTPKDKALELFHKFAKQWHASPEDVKINCIICVDEIMLYYPIANDDEQSQLFHNYWNDVKKEISLL